MILPILLFPSLARATGDRSPDSRSSRRRLVRDRIEGVCLLHLGEIGNDSRLISVLKIHDENGRRSGIKFFIGKQCGKA